MKLSKINNKFATLSLILILMSLCKSQDNPSTINYCLDKSNKAKEILNQRIKTSYSKFYINSLLFIEQTPIYESKYQITNALLKQKTKVTIGILY